MAHTLMLFLAALPGTTPETAASFLRSELLALGGDDGIRARAVVASDVLSTAESAHGDELDAGPAFVGVLALSTTTDGADPVALIDAVTGVADRCGSWLVPAESIAVVGEDHTIVAGDEPLVLAMALRRLPELSPEHFMTHWITTHAELGRAVPGSQGYRQVRADTELSAQAAAAADLGLHDLDGVALACYSDVESLFAILGDESIAEPLLEDEKRFIDHSRAAMVIGWGPAVV